MEFGARPLKRIVQSQVETLLARKMISGEIKEGDKIEVFYDKNIKGLNVILNFNGTKFLFIRIL